MDITFYADIFLMVNWYMDFLTFYAVGKLLAFRAKVRKILFFSFLESLAGLLCFLLLRQYVMYQLISHFILGPIFLYALFWPKQKEDFWKSWIASYLIMLYMGGFVEWGVENTGISFPWILVLTTLPVLLLTAMARWRRHKVATLFQVSVYVNERQVALSAYFDSGNLLIDPFTGKAVHIMGHKKAEKLEISKEKCRWIPFRSLGQEHGLLQVFTADKMEIRNECGSTEVASAVIGITDEKQFQGRNYEMILNAAVQDLL